MSSRASLPPLQLLVTFEAAGRRLSFKEAARELHVTPSAVSQQLRTLESTLGQSLFDRKQRAVSLTDAGAFYLEVTREALELIQRGTERLRERFGRRTLRLSADAAVAYEVVIPALPDFQARHPDLDLRIETSSALLDPERDGIDAAIRFGRAPWPRLSSDPLAAMRVTAVAAPSLLRKRPLREPGELARHVLIEVAGAPDHWSLVAGQLGFRPERRIAFDSYLATLQAAAHGVGVALGLFPLSTAWVRDGRLVAPLWPLAGEGYGYHLVCRPEERASSELVALRSWLEERFRALPRLVTGRAARPKAR
jgi:LysR family glycine cleavage system transcriptional activator